MDWKCVMPPLREDIIDAVKSLNFDNMTPVQAATIPQLLARKDVAVEAVTGSGKTLAFVIPMLQMLIPLPLRSHDTAAVIVTPTRELAIQIDHVIHSLLHQLPACGITVQLFIGGSSVDDDTNKFKQEGCNVLIATPGRLADLLQLEDFGLSHSVKSLELLILDEADRLLELGFKEKLDVILKHLPKQRRTGLFSATQTKQLQHLVRAGLRNPMAITVHQKQRLPDTLSCYYKVTEPKDKINNLVGFLLQNKLMKIMIFFSTCAAVDYFSEVFKSKLPQGINMLAIHGKMKSRRIKIFKEFSILNSGILLCTDLMSRGVDIPSVDWILHLDAPNDARSFIHRSGRTARMGREGKSLLFLLPSEIPYIEFLRLNQATMVTEYTEAIETIQFSLKIKKLARSCREIYEKGLKAFVSMIQAYSKHECSLIFKLKELDVAGLVESFGLLHTPHMPELRGHEHVKCDINTDKIPYKNKVREKLRRQKMLEQQKQERPQITKKHRKVGIIKKKKFKRKKLKQHHFTNEELDELAKEACELKKWKAGKITKEQLEVMEL